MSMKIEEIVERTQALVLEWQLLREEMKEYGNCHATVTNQADQNYLYKANQYPGDITPARIARVSSKILESYKDE